MGTPEPISSDELQRQLAGFCGTLEYHRLTAFIEPEILWTDGCAFLAEQAQCYWLMDAIASHQLKPQVRQEPFQIWALQVTPRQAEPTRPEPMASLTCRTDTEPEGKLLVTQHIAYTDFPLDSIKLYVVHGSIDGVHPNSIGMLPGEY
jgi:hypothetical protein